MERSVAAKINNEVHAAVDEVLKKYGFTLDRNSMRYGDYDLSFTIRASSKNEDGKKNIAPSVMHWAKRELESNDKRWADVPEEDIFGKKWYVAGLGFCTIEDYNSRRRKYPFNVRTEAGRSYRTTSSSIKFER